MKRKENGATLPMDQKMDFSRYRGKTVKVGILDSGVDPTRKDALPVRDGIRFFRGGDGVIHTDSAYEDAIGHGTACAGIINVKAPDAELYPVRIFGNDLTTDIGLFEASISWCVERGIRVVNVSLGTTDVNDSGQLKSACDHAARHGVVIVAAEANDRRKSYPASFPNVIGVTAGRLRGKYDYYYRPDHSIECVARGDKQRLHWRDPKFIFLGGTSFAAPHITGLVCLILERFPDADFETVKSILAANALQGRPELVEGAHLYAVSQVLPRRRYNPSEQERLRATGGAQDGITRAVLYPYCKEMHAVIRYRDLVSFQIAGIADVPGRMTVAKDAGTLIGIPEAGLTIGADLQQEFAKGDTVILGYLDRVSTFKRRDLLLEACEAAVAMDKNIFSFLPLSGDAYKTVRREARERNLKITWPSLTFDGYARIMDRAPESWRITAPVLGVFGTGPSQGKFTTQLCLRKWLTAAGYKVGQIGTEHHCSLFGFDFTFPIGYGAAACIQVPMELHVSLLQRAMQIIDSGDPDIIIVGSQSGLIPHDFGEHSGLYTLPSLAFLLGTQPDAYVLVVNSIDSEAYIRDTINVLTAMGKGSLIALVFGDREKEVRSGLGADIVVDRPLAQPEIDAVALRLERTFGVPATEVISRQGQLKLFRAVINHFSSE